MLFSSGNVLLHFVAAEEIRQLKKAEHRRQKDGS
jgi:hypothetical protein